MNVFAMHNFNTAGHASAHCAEASFACMNRAFNNSIMIILGVTIVASIIICALASLLGLSLLLVVLAVLLLNIRIDKPKKRTTD